MADSDISDVITLSSGEERDPLEEAPAEALTDSSKNKKRRLSEGACSLSDQNNGNIFAEDQVAKKKKKTVEDHKNGRQSSHLEAAAESNLPEGSSGGYQSPLDMFLNTIKKYITNPEELSHTQQLLIKLHSKVSENFRSSKHFRRIILEKIEQVDNKPLTVFSHVQEILDELRIRKKSKTKVSDKLSKMQDEAGPSTSTNSEAHEDHDVDTMRKIRRLKKTLETLNLRIRYLQNQDVDWESEGDSVYMQEDRFKARAFKIWKKLCEYTGEKADVIAMQMWHRVRLGDYQDPVKRAVEKFVRKTARFPDYHDIRKIVESTCDLSSSHKIDQKAQEVFQYVGNLLQAQRKRLEWGDVCHFLEGSADPADSDPALAAKLKEHEKLSKITEENVLAKYTEEQAATNAEPEEVPDEDADKSPEHTISEDEVEAAVDEAEVPCDKDCEDDDYLVWFEDGVTGSGNRKTLASSETDHRYHVTPLVAPRSNIAGPSEGDVTLQDESVKISSSVKKNSQRETKDIVPEKPTQKSTKAGKDLHKKLSRDLEDDIILVGVSIKEDKLQTESELVCKTEESKPECNKRRSGSSDDEIILLD